MIDILRYGALALLPRARRRAVAAAACAAALAGLLAAAPPSGATPPPLSVTAPTTTNVAANTTGPVSGLSVSGDVTDTLQVTIATDVGTLSMGTTSGLTLAYNNHWSGDAAITFTGLESDVDTGLSSAMLSPGNTAGATAHITITAMVAVPSYVYLAPNQHFYRYFPASDITWTDADTAAKGSSFLGQPGYLATIPNATVNDFVSSKIQGATSVWFGARAYYPDAASGFARAWRWAQGSGESPIAGQPISYCLSNAATTTCSFSNNAGLYNAWAPGEPNNYNGSEDAAVTNWQGTSGAWNDLNTAAAGIDGYVVEYGNQAIGSTGFAGVVSAQSGVAVATVPSAPGSVSAVRGDHSATVSFTPAADNGSAVTGYTVTSAPDGITGTCGASPCTVTGLTNGTSYTFTVTATNAYGTGPASAASAPVTPATVPGVPGIVAATRGDRAASVSFTAPASDGGAAITGYTVTSAPDGITGTCGASPCTVTGLTNGTSYTFTVHASNAVGDGPESDATAAVTPATTPDAPTAVSAARADQGAEVSFTTPAGDGGSAITGYLVTSQPGGATTPCPGSPCTVTGLTNGTAYTFTVQALNDVGAGPASLPSVAVVPATVPDAVTGLAVERDDASARLSFTAPASDGGDPITGYQVSTDGGTTWAPLATTGSDPLTGTVSGLTNGTAYDVEVRAVNTVGGGAAAGPRPVTPATVPDAPGAVTATRGDAAATVTWDTPADGGDAITGYTVTVAPGGATTACAASPCTVTGLTNGTGYTVTVRATNSVGAGAESAPSGTVVPATTPDAPQQLTVTSDDASVPLGFAAPARDGGDPITGYQVSTDGGTSWAPLTTAGTGPFTATVTGLANGTRYAVMVRAVNTVGAGPGSAIVPATPATVPGAPTGTVATVSGTKITVSWRPPADDGGAPITGYVVVAQPGGYTRTTAGATRCVFTDLPTGIAYHFSVTATNASGAGGGAGTGTGSGSGPSGPAVPIALPSAPVRLAVHPGDRVLRVVFGRPLDDGGAPIGGYRVSLDAGRHWAWLATTGRAVLHATVGGVLDGHGYRVEVRAVNVRGAGSAAGPVAAATARWFGDPISGPARRAEHPVPAHPAWYSGPVVRTRADARSWNGTPAYSGLSLRGRQLQPGQAASLGMDGLFAFDRARLTADGRRQVRAIVSSLRYAHAVVCEGYADYGGHTAHQDVLSRQRARALCTALRQDGARVRSTVRGYGARRPVVIGGTPADRAANRRVVLLVVR